MVEGITLKPQLISNNTNRKNYSAVYSRPGVYEPVDYYASWIDNSIGYVGVANIAVPNALSIVRKIDLVKDIAICFDGTWNMIGDGFIFITNVQPIVAVCKLDGSISVIHDSGEVHNIPGSYTNVSIVRGWKSLIDDSDQLLTMVASSGNVVDVLKYSGGWYTDSSITVDDVITGLDISLLSDYRLCLQVYSNYKSYTYYTDRFYIGGASLPEKANVNRLDKGIIEVSISKIDTSSINSDSGTALINNLQIDKCSIELLSNKQPSNIYAYNIGDTIIKLYIDAIYDLKDSTCLSIKSNTGIELNVISVSKQGYEIVINCKKFNNYPPYITIAYENSSKGLLLSSGESIESFNVEFKAIGLVPDEIEPPIIEFITNLEVN